MPAYPPSHSGTVPPTMIVERFPLARVSLSKVLLHPPGTLDAGIKNKKTLPVERITVLPGQGIRHKIWRDEPVSEEILQCIDIQSVLRMISHVKLDCPVPAGGFGPAGNCCIKV